MDDMHGIQTAKVTLVDKVRDGIIGILKEMPSTWGKLDEVKQAQYIELAARVATQAVNGCCDIIASDGREVVDVQIGNVTANKTTVNAVVTVPRDKHEALTLFGVAHGSAKMAFVDVGKYTRESNRPAPTPDQTNLLDEGAVSKTAEAIKEGVRKASLAAKKKKEQADQVDGQEGELVQKKMKDGLPDPEGIRKHMDNLKEQLVHEDELAAVEEEFLASKREDVLADAEEELIIEFIDEDPKPRSAVVPESTKPKRAPRAPRRKVVRDTVEVADTKKGGRKRTVAVEKRQSADLT